MRWALRSACCCLAWCVLGTAAASEDGGSAIDGAARADDGGAAARWTAAQRELDRARAATRAQDLPAALHALQAAYSWWPDARLLYNLAQIERALDRPVDALAHYQRFLREIDRSEGDADFDRRISEAEQHVSRLRLLGEIEVVGQPEVEVDIDERPARVMPIVASVGRHVVRCRRGGLQVARDVEVEPGRRIRVEPDFGAMSKTGRAIQIARLPTTKEPIGISAPAPASARSPSHRPIYRRWQFWTAVAGALAGAGAVFLISRELGAPPPCPPMTLCGHPAAPGP